jgi:hypothetical protein
MVIFHSYVSLPEGNFYSIKEAFKKHYSNFSPRNTTVFRCYPKITHGQIFQEDHQEISSQSTEQCPKTMGICMAKSRVHRKFDQGQ